MSWHEYNQKIMIRNLEVGGQKITDTAGSGKLLTRECDTNVKNTVMNPFVEKMSVVFTWRWLRQDHEE
jgi:hypothetical protein